MKRKPMFILYIVALVAVGIAGWYVYRYFHSAAYFLSRLPEEYKQYPSLGEEVASQHHRIKPLCTGRISLVAVDDTTQTVVIGKMDTEQEGEIRKTLLNTTYYRLDVNGNVIDTLADGAGEEDWGREFNGHLLYKNHYTNYLTGGGAAQLPYKETNAALKMEAYQLKTLVNALYDAADASLSDHEYDSSGSRQVFFFSIKGKVQKVYAPSPNNIDIDTKFGTRFRTLIPITAHSYEDGRRYNWTGEKSPLRIRYFLREDYNPARRAGIMAPAPTNTPANWDGTGYFSLTFPNDSLVFKHPCQYYPKNGSWPAFYESYKWGKLDYFPLPGCNFQLLTVGYDTDYVHSLDGCYVVVVK